MIHNFFNIVLINKLLIAILLLIYSKLKLLVKNLLVNITFYDDISIKLLYF